MRSGDDFVVGKFGCRGGGLVDLSTYMLYIIEYEHQLGNTLVLTLGFKIK